MYYVIIRTNHRDIYGPFPSREAAYAYVASVGGIDMALVISDKAAQQAHQHRTIRKP